MKTAKILPLALIVVLGACKKEESTTSAKLMDAEQVEQAKLKRGKEIVNEEVQNKLKAEKTSLEFNEEVHDFGNIPYENKVETIFKVKNTGDNPLVIFNATASCGCTIPEKPSEPILPGEEGDLKVAFKPNVAGSIHKKITLTTNTNAVDGKEFVTIKAFVAPKK